MKVIKLGSEITAELKIWKRFVFDNMPVKSIEARVLCTYTTAYKAPFKFQNLYGNAVDKTTDNPLASYNKGGHLVQIREDEYETVLRMYEDKIAEFRKIVGKFPDSVMFVRPRNVNYLLRNGLFHIDSIFGWPSEKKVGKLTGRYYIDIYSYVWFELNAYFLPDRRQLAWVRETAIDYDGKEELQPFIQEQQNLVMQLRGAGTTKKSSKLLGFLTLGLTLLSSK